MTKANDLVSIIITCYNYGRYLPFCLESALSQTYENIEVVVVNDGSTDDTDDIMHKYVSNPRVRYIRQDNAGQAHAKNTGIRNARGAFVAFLDADDIWDARKLEKQIPLFLDRTVGVVYSVSSYIDEGGQEVKIHGQEKYLVPRSGNVAKDLYLDNFIPFSSAVVRRECLDNAGLFDESLKMGIDWDLWLRISVHHAFAYVHEPLLRYRIGHTGQMSKNLEERQRCSDRIMRKFVGNNPGILSRRDLVRAESYTHCNRGYYYRSVDIRKSNRHYCAALKSNPTEWSAYRGLLKNMYLLLCGRRK